MDLSFFAEMAWKSALISGAALMLAYVLRSRAASDRAVVLRLGVIMLLLMPLIAMSLPALEIVAFAAPEAPPPVVYVAGPDLALESLSQATTVAAPEPTIWDDPTPLVILAYLGGLAMVGSRLLAGLFLLGRWTRSAEDVTDPEWRAAFERVRWIAGDGEKVRLLVSDGVKSPLSWGWRNPVILLDPDTVGLPDDAEAILAHEMAHIARRDWPVLIVSRIAATLFWFNPLVWMLEREVVQQAEEAADCEAASRMEPTRYAETLLTWAHVNGALPANSIAPSTSALGRRVRAILDGRSRNRPSGSAWTGIAAVICLAIAAPVAAMKLVAAARPDPVRIAQIDPGASTAPSAPAAPGAPAAPAAPMAPDAPEVGETIEIDVPDMADMADLADLADLAEIGPAVNASLAAVLPQIPRIVASATAAVHPHEVDEALREAEQELREAGRLNRQEIARAMREARREVARARVQVRNVRPVRVVVPRPPRVDHEAIRRSVAEAHRAAAQSRRAVAVSMAHSADGMLRGADGMERGADRMEQTAHRLRTDRTYREREIARARERGDEVTHEELIEAADDMREGAQGMREGAREMREAARRMRGRDS